MTRESQGFVGQSSPNVAHAQSNHLCLTSIFFRITIFCRVRAWEQKVCGRGLKICQISSFFGPPCIARYFGHAHLWRRWKKSLCLFFVFKYVDIYVIVCSESGHLNKTSSSAVAKRPRDASCLSVVSFNSIIPQAQFFITSYFRFKFTSASNSILFCCLRHNVEPCCHTHYSRRPWLCIARERTWSISHGTQQRVDRAWSSNTRRKQKAGRRVRNTNYGAEVIDCKAR